MVKEVVKRDPTRIKMFFKHLREKNCHLRFALLEKKLALHPLPFLSLIFPISLPFANFLLVTLPYANMEPSPKKTSRICATSPRRTADVICKLMAALKKHLKIKDQLEAQVEQELQKVKDVAKRDPTLRIFVRRLGIFVLLKVIKVILILLILVFLI